jgi:hypothetical protein
MKNIKTPTARQGERLVPTWCALLRAAKWHLARGDHEPLLQLCVDACETLDAHNNNRARNL